MRSLCPIKENALKCNNWFGYLIAPLTGPLLYGIIVLFIPSVTSSKEFGAESWLLSISLFILASYVIALIIGAPLLLLLRKYNKLSFWWASLLFSIIYAIFIYLILFVILDPNVTGNIYLITATALLISGSPGFIISTVFLKITGITRPSSATRLKVAPEGNK